MVKKCSKSATLYNVISPGKYMGDPIFWSKSGKWNLSIFIFSVGHSYPKGRSVYKMIKYYKTFLGGTDIQHFVIVMHPLPSGERNHNRTNSSPPKVKML